ncbi:MAG: hypothetical protein FVQ79_03690 [Planctomycetes bacterium]|nr:hypothetical protein [Planctomycetota bacterium]
MEVNDSYKEFYGPVTKHMHALVAERMVPLSVAGLMQDRIEVGRDVSKVNRHLMNNYYDTGDAIVYHPDGRIKIVLDSQLLRSITPKSELRDGALVVSDDNYAAAEGVEFKSGDLGRINSWLSPKEIKAHPVWQVLARDQALLDEYTDYILAEANESFGYDVVMGVFLESKGYEPQLRTVFIGGIANASFMGGGNDIDNRGGRLIGIKSRDQNVGDLVSTNH